jgi:hypothetical protein
MAEDTIDTTKAVCALVAAISESPLLTGYCTAAYPFPNDETELDRMDMQYEMLRQVNDGRIFFSPLRDPERILDIGTGSGIWPIEMGMFYWPKERLTVVS